MGTKMHNSPLYFTIGQIQFNPILNLKNFVPTIQEKMRAMHFPDFQHELVHEILIPVAMPGNQSSPNIVQKDRFKFGDVEGWEGFAIEQNQLLYYTTRYDTFEVFLLKIKQGLSILHEVIRLDFVERLGLRYLDAVRVSSEETLSQYLTPEVRGLSAKLDGALAYSISETVTATPSGQLSARIITQNGKIGMPAELAGITNKFSGNISAYDGLHAIIDNDASYAQRMSFDLDMIEKHLHQLHDAIKLAFEMSVTNHAREQWA